MGTKTNACMIFIVVFILLTVNNVSAIPPLISYQGAVTDNTGALLADGEYEMFFRLYDVENGGDALWAERQKVTLSNGIFSIYLGAGERLIGDDLAPALFSPGNRWLEVQVGSNNPMKPRQKLASVPYAFKAAEADNATTFDGMTKTELLLEIKKMNDKITLLRKRQSGSYDGALGELPPVTLYNRFKEGDNVVVVPSCAIIADGGNVAATVISYVNWDGSNFILTFRFNAFNGEALPSTARIALTWIAAVED